MEQESADFVAAIDVYTQDQTKNLLAAINGMRVILFTKLIDIPSSVLESFGLNSDIMLAISLEADGSYQASYFYKGLEMKPDVDFINYDESASILTMLRECIRQDTSTPKIESAVQACEYCGSTEAVTVTSDPYSAEIESDLTELPLCQTCVDKRADEI